MSRFTSRKFLMPLCLGALLVLNHRFNLGLSEAEVQLLSVAVVTYIAAEGAKDLKVAGMKGAK